MSATYAVVWPRSARSVEVKALAPRLASLEGKTVAFLWDYLFRGDEIWPTLSEELGRRYPGMRFVGWEEFRRQRFGRSGALGQNQFGQKGSQGFLPLGCAVFRTAGVVEVPGPPLVSG